MKRIRIVAMGGTIAGTGSDPASATNYRPAVLNTAALIRAIPSPGNGIELVPDDFHPAESAGLVPGDWTALAEHVESCLNSGDDGIVVTHGTDTLEETAYFLNLTVHSAKPVILTGAMRPASALSADGPKNLYDSILAAASDSVSGLGAMICMNGVLAGAREACKRNAQRPDSFVPRESGMLGIVSDREVRIYFRSARKHTLESEFRVAGLKTLPEVGIVYSYAGAPAGIFDRFAGIPGLVLDCVGNGNLSPEWRRKIPELVRSGTVAVRCSRAGGFVNRNGAVSDDLLGTVAGDTLSAQKARILLMLCLEQKFSASRIQRAFGEY